MAIYFSGLMKFSFRLMASISSKARNFRVSLNFSFCSSI